MDSAAGSDRLLFTAADGATAELELPWPPVSDLTVAGVAAHAARQRTALVVLVRRGGYAAGMVRDGAVLTSSLGTRYVQGRTAAGGWSQQRFARRRSGQADALSLKARDAVLAALDAAPQPEVVVPGGDRALVTRVFADPRLRRVAALPRGPLLDVPDPRRAVLDAVAERARAVRVRLTEP